MESNWIPVAERLPEERDSIFAKYKGTEKWKSGMFEKVSDIVNVTVADDKGNAVTTHAHTVDGEWSCDLVRFNKSYKITAWMPKPEPYHPEEPAEHEQPWKRSMLNTFLGGR